MPALPKEELAKVISLLEKLRLDLQDASGGNKELLFSMKRYIAIRFLYDERGTPAVRRKLKDLKWKLQRGLYAECKGDLPIRGAELDRTDAILGYTEENTRLVCHNCHRSSQEARNFA